MRPAPRVKSINIISKTKIMYIQLRDRIKCDRLGTHLLYYVAQIIVATVNNIYIFLPENRQLFCTDNIFAESLFYYINLHNAALESRGIELGGEIIIEYGNGMNHICGSATQTAGCSIPEYFRAHIWPKIAGEFERLAAAAGYTAAAAAQLGDDSIVCHLRLDDIAGRNIHPMTLCVKHYRELMNAGKETPIENFFDDLGCRHNCQGIMPTEVVEEEIAAALKRWAEYKVFIVTSPVSTPDESLANKYTILKHEDPALDLYIMCKSRVFIGSRSTYAICAIMWGEEKMVARMPRWGHLTCCGVGTKYCADARIEEFY
jgi:hypothetical protein